MSQEIIGELGRREFLTAGMSAVTLGSLAGCDLFTTDPAPTGAPAGDNDTDEAPMLTERVDAGELPPVAERLPAEPLVVPTVSEPGRYGGTLTSAILGPAEAIQLFRLVGYDNLMRWDPEWSQDVLANVAKSVTASDDATEFTCTLRAGMRWSDGAPFTAADVVFTHNEIRRNTEIYPSQPLNPATAEEIDEHTVLIRFEQPNGLYLHQLATPGGGAPGVMYPRHYLTQFHTDFADDIDAVVDEEGATGWVELLQAKMDIWTNAELPTLFPWVVTTPVGEANRVELERNQYYWKVDPDGRQLPYIDQVIYQVISDPEVVLLNAMNGDIDFQLRPVNTLSNKPSLAQGAQEGGYRLFDAIPSNMNTMALSLNLVHQDEELRSIFQEKDFRVGLSYAIDRQEIIDAAYQRQGEPFQCAPRPDSPHYDEQLAKQYTDHDVQLANEHLDQVLPDTDADGFRLRPNKSRLILTVEFALGIWPDWPDVLNLVKDYWAQVGIEMRVQGHDRSLFEERTHVDANEYDAVVWQGDGGGGDIYLSPHYYFPHSINAYYARAWGKWYSTGGAAGQDPPQAAQQQMKIYDDILATSDADEQAALMAEILRIAGEEFWVLGINLQPEEYGVASNRLRNVPDSMPNSWLFPTPGPTNPEQYFIEE